MAFPKMFMKQGVGGFCRQGKKVSVETLWVVMTNH
jgi:hypothetical protein